MISAQDKVDMVTPYIGKKVYVIMFGEDGNVRPYEVTLKSAKIRGDRLALVEFNEYPNYTVSADLVGVLNESNQFRPLVVEKGEGT